MQIMTRETSPRTLAPPTNSAAQRISTKPHLVLGEDAVHQLLGAPRGQQRLQHGGKPID